MKSARQVKINKNFMDRDYKLYSFDAEVLSDVEVKEWGSDLTDRSSEKIKFKTCFRAKSTHTGREIDCVFWGNGGMRKGDIVHLEGKIRGSETQKCFVIYKYEITKRTERTNNERKYQNG